MRGLHVKEAAPYLLPLGVKPVAEGLGLTMSAHLTTWAANATGDQIKANLDIDKLSIVADGQPAVLVEKINLATGPIGTGSTDLGSAHHRRCKARFRPPAGWCDSGAGV